MSSNPIDEILKTYWGYDSFREGQESIINAVLEGVDTLALLPTGGGKSICYQIPAIATKGITLVVSPLIALMNDQVATLKKLNIKVEVVHSALNKFQIDTVLDNCIYGNIKLLYISPERLQTDLFLERAKKMNINFIAVDEAHCISEWGYDFRPSYLKIDEFRQSLPKKVSIIALTATATPEVVNDIIEKLNFDKNHQFFQQSFFRENLAYIVANEASKMPYLFNLLDKIRGSAIVYVRSRRQTVEIAKQLVDRRLSATYYHAGVSYEKRTLHQEQWINNDVKIMVSTNAFGMGIDKSDVQLIVHMDVPDSLESYFQEAGRAGRDGEKAYAILLWNKQDFIKLNDYHELSFPEVHTIKSVYSALGSYYKLAVGSGLFEMFEFDLFDFSKKFNFDPLLTLYSLKLLEQNEILSLSDNIYTPATIRVACSKDDLYDFQLRNRKYNIILKALLRYAEGIFINDVRIDISKFSKFVNVPKKEVLDVFNRLVVDGIIEFRSSSYSPKLTFLMERLHPNGLNLDLKSYRKQKEVKKKKIIEIEKYVHAEKCRSQLLLGYFGEKFEELCGACDYCRSLNKGRTVEDLNTYKEKIKQVLKKGSISLEDLMSMFLTNRHEKVLDTLHFLIGEGYIVKENNLLIWQGK